MRARYRAHRVGTCGRKRCCNRGRCRAAAVMAISLDLAINALVAGLLLGGFYAAVTVGVTIAFGMLDIVNIAHPAFIMLGCYLAYLGARDLGLDPILGGILAMQGIAFFCGMLFVAEVGLILAFGVDYRFVEAPYIGPSLKFGIFELPLRMLVPFLCSLAMVALLQLYLSRSFIGRAILAVSQDRDALRLMAVDPIRIKRIAFGTAALAGAFLIIIQPVQPSVGRDYLGRVFAICVLGGMTSFPGMVAGAILIGIVESLTATFYGPSWAPAVAFGFLLLALAVRPSGILGR